MEKDEELKKLYLEEQLILRVTNVIFELMEEQEIKKVDLAKRINRSKGYVTQILDGTANLTLKTISNILFELDCTLAVKAGPIKEFAEERRKKITFLKTNYPVSWWRNEFDENEGNYYPKSAPQCHNEPNGNTPHIIERIPA